MTKKKILVVDDDEGITEVVQIVLEGEGYEVKTSKDGECFANLSRDLADLILLDLLLAGADGRALCKMLKNNEQTRHIPIVVLSAHANTGQLADDSGADDFLQKPFDVDVLIDVVAHNLALHALKAE